MASIDLFTASTGLTAAEELYTTTVVSRIHSSVTLAGKCDGDTIMSPLFPISKRLLPSREENGRAFGQKGLAR